MLIDDPTIAPLQLKISYQGTSYVLENLDSSVDIRLNGKSVSGQVPIKEKDNLNLGRTTINFSRMDTADFLPPPPYEHPQNVHRLTPGSKEKAILDALEFLERNSSDSPASPPIPGSMPKPPIPGNMPKPPLPPGKKS